MSRKIVVTVATNDGMSAVMDEHFGRSPYFLLVADGDMRKPEILQNDVENAVHGAGTRAAAIMGANGVTDVISGQFGPKAVTALAQLQVRMWSAPAGLNAREAIDEFSKGNLAQFQMKVFH